MMTKQILPPRAGDDWNDHRGQLERCRGAAETSLEYAEQAEAEGDLERAGRLRARAAVDLRQMELHARLLASPELIGDNDFYFRTLDVEAAHTLLDRFEAVKLDDLIANPEQLEHVQVRFELLRERAAAWEFAAEVRQQVLNEVVNMVRTLRKDGAELNLSALARLTGISRQTLHARLRDAG